MTISLCPTTQTCMANNETPMASNHQNKWPQKWINTYDLLKPNVDSLKRVLTCTFTSIFGYLLISLLIIDQMVSDTTNFQMNRFASSTQLI